MTKYVVVASGKGGVGKTTTALNLAVALSNFGREVLVLDANISTPNLALHLGAPNVPITLHDALRGKNHIKDAAYLHPSGLKVIPSSISIKDSDEDAIEKLEEILPDLKGVAEVIIIDAAAGLGKEATHAIKSSDEAIIVTNPDVPSVTDALKTIKRCDEKGTKVLGVVVTKFRSDPYELSIKNIETILEKPVIGIIPHDENVRKSLYLKNPVGYSHPNSDASIAYKKLAANLIGEKYVESIIEKKGLFDYVLTRLGFKK
ncbi:septum site-determining protein MinD [Candidatus Woesearchaeota archaeon]|mgnify:CR=1 FL=1|nr:MAG: septum site-determining protein MinD [Candidatus Woesearchaeota archaeon]